MISIYNNVVTGENLLSTTSISGKLSSPPLKKILIFSDAFCFKFVVTYLIFSS